MCHPLASSVEQEEENIKAYVLPSHLVVVYSEIEWGQSFASPERVSCSFGTVGSLPVGSVKAALSLKGMRLVYLDLSPHTCRFLDSAQNSFYFSSLCKLPMVTRNAGGAPWSDAPCVVASGKTPSRISWQQLCVLQQLSLPELEGREKSGFK